jgi:thiamine-phosphate pyrophosphorylase
LSGKCVLERVRASLEGGADIIQLRAKDGCARDNLGLASKLARLARRYGVPFIVNDDLGLAIASGADGCHLGQGDIGITLARKLLGAGKIIGASCGSVAEATRAKAEGADYVGAGPVFKTPVKKGVAPKGEAFLTAIKKTGIPFFAIGGIDASNIGRLRARGVRAAAVIRAVSFARDPYLATAELKEALA